MTFKHVKFEDSPTMRALEKVAKEKGLVKPESLQKRASIPKKADYTPSSDFMENIFKLCAGLRSQGLEKEASEVEVNYLNYKRAQTLYETSKETGEDLVQSAHPKGSHKLEGVDSDEATIEDILDQHSKSVEMVNKKPTGKLSTAAQLVREVKRALAEDESVEEEPVDAGLEAAKQPYINLLNQTTGLVGTITRNEDLSDITYHAMGGWMGGDITRDAPEANTGVATKTTKGHFENVIENVNELARKEPSIDTVKELRANLNAIMTLIGKASNISAVTKNKYTGQARTIYSKTESIINLLRGQAPKTKPNTMKEVTIQGDPLSGKLGALISRLQAAKAVRSISGNPGAIKWIDDELKEIQGVQKTIDGLDPAQRQAVETNLQNDISTYQQEVDQFYNEWVNVKR